VRRSCSPTPPAGIALFDFAKRVGGHAAALDVAEAAQAMNVARLVFAHVGKPTIHALDAGKSFPFGELGQERTTYELI
jgi:hypothetical protein